MTTYLYPISLALVSVLVMALERLFPRRPEQRQLRPRLASDLAHLVFNGHFLGVMLAGAADAWVLPHVDALLANQGLTHAVHRNAASSWPLALQVLVALLLLDFLQWGVHRLLHRVPFLWELHKVHHSAVDGQFDWLVAFRFSWLELVVYKTVLYLPLVFFGFAWEALMVHAVFGTLIGHLNHANVRLDYGPLGYVLNSPKMHIWHHDYDGTAETTVNFGIIFSCWDWIFGTAKLPDQPPARLGFEGVSQFPKTFLTQEIWPLQRLFPPMHPTLKTEFEKEMSVAHTLYRAQQYREAFTHLERAHVLGQRHAWPHTLNHWWMLKVGFRLRDGREVFGQLLRIAVAGIGSLLGRAPRGNTGGANVGILTPMEIPADLAEILRRAS